MKRPPYSYELMLGWYRAWWGKEFLFIPRIVRYCSKCSVAHKSAPSVRFMCQRDGFHRSCQCWLESWTEPNSSKLLVKINTNIRFLTVSMCLFYFVSKLSCGILQWIVWSKLYSDRISLQILTSVMVFHLVYLRLNTHVFTSLSISCCLSPVDIDECSSGHAKCSHGCINMLGSFRCVCHPGFELGAEGKQCYRKSKHWSFNIPSENLRKLRALCLSLLYFLSSPE